MTEVTLGKKVEALQAIITTERNITISYVKAARAEAEQQEKARVEAIAEAQRMDLSLHLIANAKDLGTQKGVEILRAQSK